tara:strand:+ start:1235 stop:2119 length:885 start_codon:yes stop_codon:yes gene_type:complete
MKKIILHLSILVIVNCSKVDSDKKLISCTKNPNAQSIVHDDLEREYLIFVPDSYNQSLATPMMLNFHGFAGTASDYMRYADMRSVAESENFILVYPQGSCSDGLSHWNPCPRGGENKSSADDLGFIQAIINDISTQYNVDQERIYATGYSNGGMMAYGLANHKSDLIAAVACVSGIMLDCFGSISHSMPILHLHGTSDNELPYNGNSDYPSVQSILEYWIGFNNTSINPTSRIDNSGTIPIEQYIYDQGDNSVSVEHLKYIGGEHVWFENTFQGYSTGELIWNFVSKYDINGKR